MPLVPSLSVTRRHGYHSWLSMLSVPSGSDNTVSTHSPLRLSLPAGRIHSRISDSWLRGSTIAKVSPLARTAFHRPDRTVEDRLYKDMTRGISDAARRPRRFLPTSPCSALCRISDELCQQLVDGSEYLRISRTDRILGMAASAGTIPLCLHATESIAESHPLTRSGQKAAH